MPLAARLAPLPALSIAIAIALTHGDARADVAHTFALDRLAPSDAGSTWIAGDDLDLRGWMRPTAGLTTSWADRPLDVYDATGARQGVVVSRQIVTHGRLSLVVTDGLRLGVVLPWVTSASGDTATIDGRAITAPAPDGIGDLRLSAIGNLWTRETTTLAWAATIWLPTGSAAAYATDGATRVQPGFRAAGSVGEWAWAAQAWATFRPTNETMRGATIGTELGGGASFGRRFAGGRWLAGVETNAAQVVVSAGDGPTTATVEAMAELRGTVVDGMTFDAGAGLGMLRGAGTPDWRLVLALDWRLDLAPPKLAPLHDAGAIAAAPPASAIVPTARAPSSEPPPRAIERTELDVGAAVASASRVAPPTCDCRAAIAVDRIVVLEDVLFETDRAEILPTSAATIRAVASVILRHPEIEQVRVDGHTDSRSDEAHNQALSEARADAVVDALVRAGVDRRRLTSAGHGARDPISTNATEEGRARNRRVTFTITETAP